MTQAKITYFIEQRLVIIDDKLFLICEECGDIIGVYQSNRGRTKSFCYNCIKKHKREKDKKYVQYLQSIKYYSSPEYRKYNRERRWREAEKKGIKIEHRYEIDNCVICGIDISMFPSKCKLCNNCREKNIYKLGVSNASQHMRRTYNHLSKKVEPDFIEEEKFIKIQKKILKTDNWKYKNVHKVYILSVK